MSNSSRMACSFAPAYFHHCRSNARTSRSRSDRTCSLIALSTVAAQGTAFAASMPTPPGARPAWNHTGVILRQSKHSHRLESRSKQRQAGSPAAEPACLRRCEVMRRAGEDPALRLGLPTATHATITARARTPAAIRRSMPAATARPTANGVPRRTRELPEPSGQAVAKPGAHLRAGGRHHAAGGAGSSKRSSHDRKGAWPASPGYGTAGTACRGRVRCRRRVKALGATSFTRLRHSQILPIGSFTGSPEEALDCAHGFHLAGPTL